MNIGIGIVLLILGSIPAFIGVAYFTYAICDAYSDYKARRAELQAYWDSIDQKQSNSQEYATPRVDPRLHPDRPSPSNELLQAAQYYTSGRDNFQIIATNIAMYYYALKQTPIGRQLEDECAQFCAILFDSASYISEGTIKEADLMGALLCADCNFLILDYTKKQYEPLTCPHSTFIQLIMQIEVLMLHADSPQVPISDVLDAVINQRHSIAQSVNDVLTQRSSHPLYPMFKNQIATMLSKPDIVDMIHTASEMFESDEDDNDYFSDLK